MLMAGICQRILSILYYAILFGILFGIKNLAKLKKLNDVVIEVFNLNNVRTQGLF